jgi:hypothetical protein
MTTVFASELLGEKAKFDALGFTEPMRRNRKSDEARETRSLVGRS